MVQKASEPKSEKRKPVKINTTGTVKLLPAPKEKQYFSVKLILRLISTLICIILGFNLANSTFFSEFPLFGIRLLSVLVILPLSGLIGYYGIPQLLYQLKVWMERLVVNTIVEIVSRFWELQTTKIQEQRREKQKIKADAERAKLEEAYKTAVVLDTSVLIDGRILDIVRLKFLDVPLIIPQEVLNEMHLLSDGKDSQKRQRGRRGLDVAKDLKKKTNVLIRPIKGEKGSDQEGVDKLLVAFCKTSGVKMATLDFNLSKVAEVAGITVLNINLLANSIKTVLLPGETVKVKIIHVGREKNQGVGYLEDGTMIVVEEAKDKVGTIVDAEVVKIIQSPAGKMFFCKLVAGDTGK